MGDMVTARGSYQVALIFFLVLFPLLCAADFIAIRTSIKLHDRFPVLFFGLALQPISAVGLWRDKAWGVILLVLAAALSAYEMMGAAIGALIVLLVLAVRFLLSARRSKK